MFLFLISIQVNAQIFPDPSPNCGNGGQPADQGDAAGNVDASVTVSGTLDASGIYNISTNELCVQGDGDNMVGCGDDPEWLVRIDVRPILNSLPICEPANFRICRRGDFGQLSEVVFVYDENFDEIGNIPGAPQNSSTFDCTQSPICTIVSLDPCIFNPQAIADGFFDLTLYTNGAIGGNSVGDFCEIAPGPFPDADFNACTNDLYCPTYTQVVNGDFLNQDNAGPLVTATCDGCNCLFIDYFAVNTNSFADPGFTAGTTDGCESDITLTPNPSNCGQFWSSPNGAQFSAANGTVTFSAASSGTYTICNNVGTSGCEEQECQDIEIGPCCDDFNSGTDLCTFITNNPNSSLATADCDGGGVDNATECSAGNDPTDPNDECDSFASGVDLCTFLENNPGSPLATIDCDGGEIDNATECANGNDPTDPNDECDNFANGEELCAYIENNPGTIFETLDCDGGGTDNLTECNSGGDPYEDIDDSCENFVASGQDLCTYITNNPGTPLATLDCDGGGTDNITECNNGSDPDNPIDDSCDSFAASGQEICTYIAANPGTPLATLDCDGGGVDNITECNNGGNPDSDIDDSCDNFEASGADLCIYLAVNPFSPLANLDCDGGGVDNQTECDEGGNPFDDIDDSCESFAASGEEICTYLGLNPNSPLATEDCDGGGVDNFTECMEGGNPDEPADDSCENFAASGLDLCTYLNVNPNSPLASEDCDGGGVDNQTECNNGGDPSDPNDDCDAAEAYSGGICQYLDDNPGSPIASADCDDGGVDNQTECDNGGDPSDPADDCDSASAIPEGICMFLENNPGSSLGALDCDGGGVDNLTECNSGNDPEDGSDDCDAAEQSGGGICGYLGANPGSTLATLDCDGGGVGNQTECDNGGNPSDPVDDSCDNFAASGLDLCDYITANPTTPLAILDCDGGGIDNQTECNSGGDPDDPVDDSCDNFIASGQDLCDYLAANPGSPLENLDCDNGGDSNLEECDNGGNPDNPIDDSCSNFDASGQELCTFIAANPNSPLATADCDNGGIDNITECMSGGNPDDPIDDSCENFEASGQDLCFYLVINPNSPLADLDCDGGGVDNQTECDDGGDPFDPVDDCDTAETYPGGICQYLTDNPNSALANSDCDNGGESNIIECNNGGNPSDPADDSCENFEASGQDLCAFLDANPNSPLANADCDEGGVDNQTECDNGGDPFDPVDDSCDEFEASGQDLCDYIGANPGTPLATLDCDNGGVNNETECNSGGNPDDPADDSCENFNTTGQDLCEYIANNLGTPLATLDCDNGGVNNETECNSGGDPDNPADDSCDNFEASGNDLCAYLDANPNSPLATQDCDSGGIDNTTECAGGGDPFDPVDDSCDNFEASGQDLCAYLDTNPGSPLAMLDCDNGGVNNIEECGVGGDPFDPADDSCDSFEASGQDLCMYIANNPDSPLAILDCDNGGVDNTTECDDGGDPSDPADDSCESFAASGQELCAYIANNPGTPLATLDCDAGGVDNQTECNSGGDPDDPKDDSCENFAASGVDLCIYITNNPGTPLATLDCDNGGVDNATECNAGGNPNDPSDDSCENFEASGQDLCEYITNNPNSPLATLDCDDGGVDNTTECDSGGDPFDPADDSCENFEASGQDLCEYIANNPGSPLATADCDDGGLDNQTECDSGGDPNDPVDDSCDNFEAAGQDLCQYIAANPNSPLATLDCDNGGVNNATECGMGGDPFDFVDDSCENFEASDQDLCTYITANPNSPLAFLDCDDGGVDNATECGNGGDPFFPSDDSCEAANADFLQICQYLAQNPNSPLATLDCDFGGIDNITECNGGGDPNDPGDDTCDFPNIAGVDLCDYIAANPNSPLTTLDCDGGGIDNQTECNNGGDPYFSPDDSCEEAEDAFLDICAYLSQNPNSPLANLDCDNGGVNNGMECNNGGDPSDPIDDSCDNFEASGEDLCLYIIFNPDSPLATADCDGGGVDNSTECGDGGDPFNEDDDSCDNFEASGEDLCHYITANPGSPLADQDCDNGGIDNTTECDSGGDPFDPADDSCDNFEASGMDLCDYITANPNSPLASADCDAGGVDNTTECNDGSDPFDGDDDSCDNFEASNQNICAFINSNPNHPLATDDCDNGGVDNATECGAGGDPFDPVDDSCTNFAASGMDLCAYISTNPNSPLATADCDNGGVDNQTECNSGSDPSNPIDDSCDSFAASGLDLCNYIASNPNSPLATADCDNGGVNNTIECNNGGNPSNPVDDSCANFQASGQNLCAYLTQNPNSPLANQDCDNGGVDNETECDNNDDPFNPNDDCNLTCDDNNECTDDILNEDNCTCEHVFSCSNDFVAPVITPDFDNAIYSGGQFTMVCNNMEGLDETSVTVTDNCDDSPTVTFVDEFIGYGSCAEDGYLSNWRCYWVAADECGNESVFEIYVTLTCPPCDDYNPCTYNTYDGCDCVYEQIPNCGNQQGHCTFPQNFYGGQISTYGGSTYIDVLNSSFANCGGYITVGLPGQSLTVADITCIDALLPAYGGVALCQPGNLVYSGLCSFTPQLGNSLIGELIVLNLNMAYDYSLENVSLCNPNNCVFAPQSVRNLLGNNCNVAGLIDLADNALGGLHGNDINLLNDILIAIRLINDGYSYCGDACIFNREIQEMIIKESTQEVATEQPELQEEAQEIVTSQKFEFSAGPNPVEDYIEFSINLVNEVNNGRIKILQLDGKELHNESFSGQKGFNAKTIDVNKLPVGMYFISIEFDNEIHFKKIMKI